MTVVGLGVTPLERQKKLKHENRVARKLGRSGLAGAPFTVVAARSGARKLCEWPTSWRVGILWPCTCGCAAGGSLAGFVEASQRVDYVTVRAARRSSSGRVYVEQVSGLKALRVRSSLSRALGEAQGALSCLDRRLKTSRRIDAPCAGVRGTECVVYSGEPSRSLHRALTEASGSMGKPIDVVARPRAGIR